MWKYSRNIWNPGKLTEYAKIRKIWESSTEVQLEETGGGGDITEEYTEKVEWKGECWKKCRLGRKQKMMVKEMK